MIEITINRARMDDIDRKLKAVGQSSAPALKKALNETAIQAREILSEKAREKYAIRKPGFRQALNLRRATQANLEAILRATGGPEPLSEFRVNPYVQSRGDSGPGRISAKVKKGSNFRELIVPGTTPPIKAFLTKFKSGHIAVVERREKGTAPKDSKLGDRYIRELSAVSVPKMIGNEESLREIEPDIMEMLNAAIGSHIAEVMGGRI